MNTTLTSRAIRLTLVAALVSALLAASPQVRAAHGEGTDYSIDVFAGSYGAGPARQISTTPSDIAVFGDTVYLVDDQYPAIRKLDLTSGRLEVVIGNESFDADMWPCASRPVDGVAGEVVPCAPAHLAVDPSSGDLYFLDTFYGAIRKAEANEDREIDQDSLVSTITSPTGENPAGPAVNIEGGDARRTRLIDPSGLTVDREGRIFVSESTADRVRMIEPDGQIWTVGGLRSVSESYGTNAGVDPEGCVNAPTPRGERYYTCVPGAEGIRAPRALALDVDGSILVAHFGLDQPRLSRLSEEKLGSPNESLPQSVWDSQVLELDVPIWAREISTATDGDIFLLHGDGEVSRVHGSEVQQHYEPEGNSITDIATYGDLLLTSEWNKEHEGGGWQRSGHAIYAIGKDGERQRLTGNDLFRYGGDGGPAPEAQMWDVTDIVYDGFGSFYLVDNLNGVLRRVDCDGTIHRAYEFGLPIDLFEDPQTIPGGPSIAADPFGNVLIRDFDPADGTSRLVQVSPWGETTTLAQPWPGQEMVSDQRDLFSDVEDIEVNGMHVDEAGRVWFTAEHQIFRYDPAGPDGSRYDIIAGNGSEGFRGDNGPARLAELQDPQSLTMDGDGNLFIADTGNQRIRRWDAHSREITTVVGTDMNELLDRLGQADLSHVTGERGEDVFLAEPVDIAYDTDGDELWVLDAGLGRVFKTRRNRLSSAGYDGGGDGTGVEFKVTYVSGGVQVGATAFTFRVGAAYGSLLDAQGMTLGENHGVVVADTPRDRAMAIAVDGAQIAECKEPPRNVTPTNLQLSMPSHGQYSDELLMNARLTSDKGEPIAGRPVEITLGTSSMTAITDAAGVAHARLPLTDEPGTHLLRASFAGGRGEGGAIAEASFRIVRESTDLAYSGDTEAAEDDVLLAATLLDDDENPVVGREVTFTIADETFSAVTAENGVAEILAQVSKHKKSEQVLVVFGGDGLFRGASTYSTVTWTK